MRYVNIVLCCLLIIGCQGEGTDEAALVSTKQAEEDRQELLRIAQEKAAGEAKAEKHRIAIIEKKKADHLEYIKSEVQEIETYIDDEEAEVIRVKSIKDALELFETSNTLWAVVENDNLHLETLLSEDGQIEVLIEDISGALITRYKRDEKRADLTALLEKICLFNTPDARSCRGSVLLGVDDKKDVWLNSASLAPAKVMQGLIEAAHPAS